MNTKRKEDADLDGDVEDTGGAEVGKVVVRSRLIVEELIGTLELSWLCLDLYLGTWNKIFSKEVNHKKQPI